MVEHINQKCKKNTFNWSIHEDVSPLTNWGCRTVITLHTEDESNQTNCEKCKSFSKIKLQDETTGYWCALIVIILRILLFYLRGCKQTFVEFTTINCSLPSISASFVWASQWTFYIYKIMKGDSLQCVNNRLK